MEEEIKSCRFDLEEFSPRGKEGEIEVVCKKIRLTPTGQGSVDRMECSIMKEGEEVGEIIVTGAGSGQVTVKSLGGKMLIYPEGYKIRRRERDIEAHIEW